MTIDWSKAPEGATHWDKGLEGAVAGWMRLDEGQWYWWPVDGAQCERKWFACLTPKQPKSDKYIARPSGWNGEGLPPVGTEVEVHRGKCVWIEKDEWQIGKTAKVMSSFENSLELGMAAIQFESGHCECILAECLRPIRTAEQIEADQKKQEVKELMIILGSVESAAYKDIAIAIQQANFRKQVSQ
ncbi:MULTISPECIES: hypothetical protein [Pseudomonas syringae group]|uniref:Uncharacterized protein n=2 Tax=Pseudomonas syringae group TaxID=136849 RepID=A0AAW4DR84_PSESX|nr:MULTISPECIES: hypothetical protein [Pseudomonas syringae group]EEB61273.1 hypothetical protein PSPTOT1_3768 [Pseudomonas syringae pv. tomato T1]KGK96188.1 hypothetical protein NB04_06920 [Pseudomonas syringae pv. tomato]KUR47672.1 hypothetical protein PSTA9_01525 [Pseudomonas syringae pv. tomato]KUR48077.1 hypothetical protein PST407_02336 [Pseudomonas syringae pv. tomato]MBI6711665.1 hypothetical protein [Pseudomonas syringae]